MGILKLLQSQRSKFTAVDPELVIRHKPPGADYRQGDLRPARTLQPTQGFVLRICQQHPVPAILQPQHSCRKAEQVFRFDLYGSKTGGPNQHTGALPSLVALPKLLRNLESTETDSKLMSSNPPKSTG